MIAEYKSDIFENIRVFLENAKFGMILSITSKRVLSNVGSSDEHK